MKKWDSAVTSSSLDPEVFRLPADFLVYVLRTRLQTQQPELSIFALQQNFHTSIPPIVSTVTPVVPYFEVTALLSLTAKG